MNSLLPSLKLEWASNYFLYYFGIDHSDLILGRREFRSDSGQFPLTPKLNKFKIFKSLGTTVNSYTEFQNDETDENFDLGVTA